MGDNTKPVYIRHKMSQVTHLTTRPVIDKILKEVLVIEDEISRSLAQLDVDIPCLHFVPNKRIVDVHVEPKLVGEQKLVEAQT